MPASERFVAAVRAAGRDLLLSATVLLVLGSTTVLLINAYGSPDEAQAALGGTGGDTVTALHDLGLLKYALLAGLLLWGAWVVRDAVNAWRYPELARLRRQRD